MKNTFSTVFALAVFALFPGSLRAATVFWGDLTANALFRANDQGGDVLPLAEAVTPRGIAIDLGDKRLYVTDPTDPSASLFSMTFDGGERSNVLTEPSFPPGSAFDVEIHSGEGRIYWSERQRRGIWRADLDGANAQMIVGPENTNIISPWGIALDVAAGKIYWVDSSTQTLQGANLDGTSVEVLATGLLLPRDLEIDGREGSIYLALDTAIVRYNLLGDTAETIFTASDGSPTGLGLDLQDGKIYWSQPSQNGSVARIRRANLDGSAAETLYSSVDGGFTDVEVVSTSGDYDGSGRVEQGDLDLVLNYWGTAGLVAPVGWINELPIGLVDQRELDIVLRQWGHNYAAGSVSASVPEPVTFTVVLLACLTLRRVRY